MRFPPKCLWAPRASGGFSLNGGAGNGNGIAGNAKIGRVGEQVALEKAVEVRG
jgi:hypothetical protein